MTWAIRRQLLYVSILIFFFGGLGFIVGYPYLNKAPTCTDFKQNGDETGVDCGGSCDLACIFQVEQISVFWARSFQIVPGRYNAVAYLENKNKNTAINQIHYKFRFADADNIYIGKREGVASIPPAGKFAIFEPAIDMGNSVPVYTTFEFTEVPVWIKIPQDKINQLKVLSSNINLENETTSPHLSAKIKNNSLFVIPDLNVVAILYDIKGNAISASQTYLEKLNPEEAADVNYTWIQPFESKVITKEIIPMYNIFSVRLK